MNNGPAQNQRIKRALKRLAKLHKIFFCFRLAGWLIIYRIRCMVARLTTSPRGRIHWAGGHRRPRRRERHVIALSCLSILAVSQKLDLIWSVELGGTIALFLVFYSIYKVFPRKRYHWIR